MTNIPLPLVVELIEWLDGLCFCNAADAQARALIKKLCEASPEAMREVARKALEDKP